MRWPRVAQTAGVFVLALAASCSRTPSVAHAPVSAAAWPEADALFRKDSRWLGADGAYSVDLGGGRVLWLFGDSFVATSDAHERSESVLVRNTLAIETGYDPSTASIAFFWDDTSGQPRAFFRDDGDGADWYWPGHGAIVEGRLVVFLSRVAPASGGLGFRADGWRAVRIDDPSASPADWKPVLLKVPSSGLGVTFGESLLVENGYLHAFGAEDASHAVHLVRWPVAAVLAGDLSAPEWRTAGGWASMTGTATELPPPLFADGATEMSVSVSSRGWVEVQTVGFGAATLDLRFAGDFTGPWGGVELAYDPPESSLPGALVYAGKGHAELISTGQRADLIATYAANSTDFATLVANDSLYYPRFVRLSWTGP